MVFLKSPGFLQKKSGFFKKKNWVFLNPARNPSIENV
jgi:hypothetical protein